MEKINRRNFIQLAGALPAGALFCAGKDQLNETETHDFTKAHDPWLEINLKNIEWNVSQIRKKVINTPVMAVIKGNAYGHGLSGVGKYLERINIDAVAVGKLQEAVELRNAGVKCPVLNFGPFGENDAELIIKNTISQSAYNDNVLALDTTAGKINKHANVHINVDTGLGRVGVPYHTAVPFIEKVSKLSNVKIEGIFTSFTEEKEFDKIQLQRFLEVCESAKSKGISTGVRHAASSAGILAFPEAYLDMVRPGIMIYGHYPSDEEYELRKIDLKPALSLKTRVSYIKTLRPGDSISYHRKFTAEKEETIATASLGYSDGFPVNITGKANVLLKGKKFPVFADITANHFYVNVTGEEDIKIGDEIVLIGNQGNNKITAEELAKAADKSVYKIVIRMNPLLPRVYSE
ncbi:hypothetical protein AMJ80_10100 [bacterium SM23_31]|nr:MAG: hypothetical protein AMJ80_10100 [bacterium SM23_31]